MLPFLVPVLFTFYIQGELKFKKKSGAKGLKSDKNNGYFTGVLLKSLARPTSRCILFDGENISFDDSLVLYIYI
jgi:hypothetical protein